MLAYITFAENHFTYCIDTDNQNRLNSDRTIQVFS